MAPGSGSGGAKIYATLTTIAVPANATTEYRVGSVSGTFRARISTTVTGGTVTVLAIRPEEQKRLEPPPIVSFPNAAADKSIRTQFCVF
jgi:hypothetical protein